MVKNSKYTFLIIGLLLGFYTQGQTFSPVNRDMEITRVTLENFLKKWDGDPLLNSIKDTEATHQKGEGVTFTITAPNANILMNTQGGMFRSGDHEIMDTFYTQEIISLQKDRLLEAVQKFVVDFYSYMPELSGNENFRVTFKVKDAEVKKDGKVLPAAKGAKTRTYQLTAKWAMNDLKDLRDGKLNASQFSQKITVEKE